MPRMFRKYDKRKSHRRKQQAYTPSMYTNTIKSPSTVTITVEGDLISNLFSL